MTIGQKFIGRKAQRCSRCGGENHFVNRLGGIQCERCSPAKSESEVVLKLRIDGGFWQDESAERFDFIDVMPPHLTAMQTEVATPTSAPAASQREKVDEKRQDTKEKSEKSGSREVVIYPSIRGPNGELSQQELDLFSSDELWNQPEWLVVLKPKVRTVDRLGRRKT